MLAAATNSTAQNNGHQEWADTNGHYAAPKPLATYASRESPETDFASSIQGPAEPLQHRQKYVASKNKSNCFMNIFMSFCNAFFTFTGFDLYEKIIEIVSSHIL
jgi:hypothetical protein